MGNTPTLYDGAAEIAGLRCAIVEPELFRNHLEPGDFGAARLGAAWAAGRHLLTAGRPVTFDTLAEELERRGIEEPVALVNELYNGGYESPAYFDGYAENILQWSRYRKATALLGLLAIPGDGGQAPDTDAMLGALAGEIAELRARTPVAEEDTASTGDLRECQPLPTAAQLDPALGLDASPWLDAYIDFSRTWAPRAYEGFHESVALGVLSTVAARRVMVHLGKERFTNLYLCNVARSSVWAKSTAHDIGADVIRAAGLLFLLAPDEATPQALLAHMARSGVQNWENLSPEDREFIKLRLGFAGQVGWSYDEFGHQVSGMMRDSGPMADFRGILRKLDDCPPTYEYQTITRGSTFLKRPYLALIASMTPADMAPYAKQGGPLWRDGFWARFAFVAPSPHDRAGLGRFPEGQRVIPAALLMPLRAWHERLGVPSVDVTERIDDSDKQVKKSWDVHVTPSAPRLCALGQGVFNAFYAYHDALVTLAANTQNDDLDGNYSRLAEKALRVAALLASLENGGLIELRHWARAQAIAERWRASLHNLYATLTTAAVSEEAEIEEQIIRAVRRIGIATANDVHRAIRSLSTTAAGTLLRQLAQAGVLQQLETTRKGTLRYRYCESCEF